MIEAITTKVRDLRCSFPDCVQIGDQSRECRLSFDGSKQRGRAMANKISLTLFAAGLLAATVVFATYAPSAAQERPAISTDFSAQQQQENKGQQKKAAPAARSAPQRAAPQRAAPQRTAPQRSAPREAAPRRTQQRVVAPQKTAPSEVTPRRTAPSSAARPSRSTLKRRPGRWGSSWSTGRRFSTAIKWRSPALIAACPRGSMSRLNRSC